MQLNFSLEAPYLPKSAPVKLTRAVPDVNNGLHRHSICLPYVSIKPNYITSYIHFDHTSVQSSKSIFDTVQPVSNRHNGLLSTKANRRVRLAIDWMCLLAKEKYVESERTGSRFGFKLNFITLTLSSKQIHSDNEIKSKLLNQFLVELRKNYGANRYLWRAESQRNGRLHFHIVTDVFIPWRALRTLWNRIQEKLGYISRYTELTRKTDPNSTDVHSIKQIKNLPAYLSKYCAKNAKGYTVIRTMASVKPFKPKCWLTYQHPKLNPKPHFYRQVSGRLWGLSQSLSKLQSCRKEIDQEIAMELDILKAVAPSKVKFKDFIGIYLFDVFDLARHKCFALLSRMRSYVREVLNTSPVAA